MGYQQQQPQNYQPAYKQYQAQLILQVVPQVVPQVIPQSNNNPSKIITQGEEELVEFQEMNLNKLLKVLLVSQLLLKY